LALDVAPEEIASKPGYVQYTVTVTDASGNPVPGLKPSDFIVRAGERSLPIKYFREDDGDAPESIVIVVDESGSMQQIARPHRRVRIHIEISG
jgi:hypothetical protein